MGRTPGALEAALGLEQNLTQAPPDPHRPPALRLPEKRFLDEEVKLIRKTATTCLRSAGAPAPARRGERA